MRIPRSSNVPGHVDAQRVQATLNSAIDELR
jgi:hypothetical protein